jgi:hypothetical protein
MKSELKQRFVNCIIYDTILELQIGDVYMSGSVPILLSASMVFINRGRHVISGIQ